MPKTIAMFNLSETSRDPRVRRIAGTLARQGHRVVVFGVKSEVKKECERLDDFEIVRVRVPRSLTNRAMRRLARTSPAAADLIQACNPQVMESSNDLREFVFRVMRFAYRQLPWKPRFTKDLSKRQFLAPLTDIPTIRGIALCSLSLFRRAEKIRPDIVHCNDLDSLLAGYMLKQKYNLPLVFDAHEIYPEQFATDMRSELWYQYYTRLEKSLLPFTDGRLTVCDSIGAYFQETHDCGPFLTVHNAPSIKALSPPGVLDRRNEPRRILYHGVYLQHRGLDQVIAAAKSVDNAQFVFRGFGPHEAALRRLAAENGVEEKVVFAPPVPVEDLVSAASRCDIGLNPFISVCRNTMYALPNKFFEYMMAGLAVASADLVEMRNLTRRFDLGILFDPSQPERIAEALNDLLADPDRLDACRRNAYETAKNEFNWEMGEAGLLDYYRQFL